VEILGISKSIPAPLVVEDSVIGVFSVVSDAITENDVPMIAAFSHQMAAALNRARLMEDLKTSLHEVEIAKQNSEESLLAVQLTLDGTVRALASTAEHRDPYTAGHQQRVTSLACAMAREMALAEDQIDGIRVAGLLHDLGKMSVPAEILNKPGRLLEMEMELIKSHPEIAHGILKEIEFPWPVAEIVLQHHERLDGSGNPAGLPGKAILIEAQILAVADVVEAMSSHRPYRPALGIDVALEEITTKRGSHFAPEAVDACVKTIVEGGFEFGKTE
jgi:putative nucleotidyltransferase with HDIG domain